MGQEPAPPRTARVLGHFTPLESPLDCQGFYIYCLYFWVEAASSTQAGHTYVLTGRTSGEMTPGSSNPGKQKVWTLQGVISMTGRPQPAQGLQHSSVPYYSH